MTTAAMAVPNGQKISSKVKLYFNSEQYHLNVDSTMNFQTFSRSVAEISNADQPLTLKYIDEDNDPIVLGSDEVKSEICCTYKKKLP